MFVADGICGDAVADAIALVKTGQPGDFIPLAQIPA
jgi:hypothetical protein